MNDISSVVWRLKYQWHLNGQASEHAPTDSWRRVADTLAQAEHDAAAWSRRFYSILEDWRFLPGGRILANAGTHADATLFNCFVLDTLDGSPSGQAHAVAEAIATLRTGGGIGLDLSPLPAGEVAPFLQRLEQAATDATEQLQRRGAMMATLDCAHPDVQAFVSAKHHGGLSHFNLSLLIGDAFMSAIIDDTAWPPGAPDARHARRLWRLIGESAALSAEPGLLFIDRINRDNNLGYREHIRATNPCGEIPLPPAGACNLGSLNLTRFVRAPFTPSAALNWPALRQTTAIAVRLLDNVYELSGFPLPSQATAARASRRIGLGITGLADAFTMLGLRYGEPASLACAARIMQAIGHAAYQTSIELAAERGPFPAFDATRYLATPFIAALPGSLRQDIARHGIRNSHLLAIAPAGSISLLAGNVSSGIEPIFALHGERQIRLADGRLQAFPVEDYALALYRTRTGHGDVPPAFTTAAEVPPAAHIALVAALQAQVDNAISKTVALPDTATAADVCASYEAAWRAGLKGITVYRHGTTVGAGVIGECEDGLRCR